jgi:hypothetical protein
LLRLEVLKWQPNIISRVTERMGMIRDIRHFNTIGLCISENIIDRRISRRPYIAVAGDQSHMFLLYDKTFGKAE